jgi:hypothetical protein
LWIILKLFLTINILELMKFINIVFLMIVFNITSSSLSTFWATLFICFHSTSIKYRKLLFFKKIIFYWKNLSFYSLKLLNYLPLLVVTSLSASFQKKNLSQKNNTRLLSYQSFNTNKSIFFSNVLFFRSLLFYFKFHNNLKWVVTNFYFSSRQGYNFRYDYILSMLHTIQKKLAVLNKINVVAVQYYHLL